MYYNTDQKRGFMKIIRLSEKDMDKYKKYEIHNDILNTEANLYIYLDYILKIFKSTDNMILDNKMYILNKLFYIKKYIDIKEIVWPNDLVKVGNIDRGYTMNFIKENSNISLIFKSDKVSMEDKLYFLRCIGKILEKVENDKYLRYINFHLGDIHEGNFIYDNKNNMLRVIDIDSSYVEGSNASRSKYLTFNDKLWDFPNKYPLDNNNRHIPNKNTTIISYVYMILNLITGYYTPDISIKEFYKILNLLNMSDFNKELLDMFINIYKKDDNYFDYDLLNTITESKVNKYKELSLKFDIFNK